MAEHLKTEQHIQLAARAANVAFWSNCPATGETWYSEAWYSILGHTPDAFEPSLDHFLSMMHPDDRAPTLTAFEDFVADRVSAYAADFRLRHADGSWRWLGATGSKVQRPGGLPYLIYGVQLDITERKETEEELAQTARTAEEHRQRLARLAENSPAALFEFRIDTEGTVTLPYITAGVHQILAVPPEEIINDGLQVFRNIFEEDMQAMGPAIETSRTELSPFRLRYRVKREDLPSGFIWVQANSAPHREADGSTVWFGSVYDITEEVRREELLAEARDAMQHLAWHDSLTGLPNRRYFDDAIGARAAVSDDGHPAAIIVRVDLDRFKYVNDTLGHAAGDQVLVHVAGILRQCFASQGMAFRMGGDEFCILMEAGASVCDAKTQVLEAQALLAAPFFFQDKPCRFGASFGIASSDQGNISNGDLMSFADAALYEAKASGRGKLVTFNNAMQQAILRSRRLASEIEAAIENRQFEPFFQPQIDAETGALRGLEVLARWRTSTGQVLTPDQFLPIAEQIRAVPLIDRLMVERCVEIFGEWNRLGIEVPKVAFNVSAGRLRESSLVSAVRPLQDQGITVAFELLESIFLEEDNSVVSFNLDAARDAGICIEIDDFGTGHASILGLMKVRPDVLKIDRRLTENVEETEQSRVLVSSILSIAKSLGVETIAEGVETKEQSKILFDLGCDMLQGYLFAAPLPFADVLAWVIRHQNELSMRRA